MKGIHKSKKQLYNCSPNQDKDDSYDEENFDEEEEDLLNNINTNDIAHNPYKKTSKAVLVANSNSANLLNKDLMNLTMSNKKNGYTENRHNFVKKNEVPSLVSTNKNGIYDLHDKNSLLAYFSVDIEEFTCSSEENRMQIVIDSKNEQGSLFSNSSNTESNLKIDHLMDSKEPDLSIKKNQLKELSNNSSHQNNNSQQLNIVKSSNSLITLDGVHNFGLHDNKETNNTNTNNDNNNSYHPHHSYCISHSSIQSFIKNNKISNSQGNSNTKDISNLVVGSKTDTNIINSPNNYNM